MKPSICSEETIDILQDLMVGVVEKGTAEYLFNKILLRRKTGTAKSQVKVLMVLNIEHHSQDISLQKIQSIPVVVITTKKGNWFLREYCSSPVFEEVRNLLYAEEAIETPKLAENRDGDYVGKVQEINEIYSVLGTQNILNLKNIWLRANGGSL